MLFFNKPSLHILEHNFGKIGLIVSASDEIFLYSILTFTYERIGSI